MSRPLAILIVEDMSPVRRLLARLLTLDGHVVIEAETLAQGFEQARSQRLDVVLLDLQLPDGDGLSLLEHWPSQRERPPVIVLTAAVTRETRERVAAAGVAVLRKPIAVTDLRAAIAQACGETEPSKPSTGFDAEMAKLTRDAQEEIARRSAELAELVHAEGPPGRIRQHAHKLAGLAAQFDAPSVAEAADRIEQACATGTPSRECLAGLALALAESAAACRTRA